MRRTQLLAALVAAAVMALPAVSQAGIFKRRDGSGRIAQRRDGEPRTPAVATWRVISGRARCEGGQCHGTYRNGPWGRGARSGL